MRLSKPVEIVSISQAMGKGGCPICAFLKNAQSALLRNGIEPDQVIEICNFHAWALAAAVDAETAARVFLSVLRHRAPLASNERSTCSICARLLADEVAQLNNLLSQLSRGLVLSWMRQQGTICYIHGEHLGQLAPAELKPIIKEIVDRSAKELEADLNSVLHSSATGSRQGGGVLGHAAEFLTSQRGVSRQ